MTTGGLHILSGLVIASFIRNEKYKKAKWGLVWGSIFPDIDVIASVIVFLITGDLEGAVFIHRTVTHGFFAMGLVLLIGGIISRTKEDWKWVSMFSIAFFFSETKDELRWTRINGRKAGFRFICVHLSASVVLKKN